MSRMILIVDDDAGTRVNLASGLRRCGYEIVMAANRPEAIEAIDAARSAGSEIDLAIVDIELAKMSGKLLIAELKKMEPTVPVFIVAGFEDKVFIIDLLNRKESSFIQATIDTQNAIRRQEKKMRQTGNSSKCRNN